MTLFTLCYINNGSHFAGRSHVTKKWQQDKFTRARSSLKRKFEMITKTKVVPKYSKEKLFTPSDISR